MGSEAACCSSCCDVLSAFFRYGTEAAPEPSSPCARNREEVDRAYQAPVVTPPSGVAMSTYEEGSSPAGAAAFSQTERNRLLPKQLESSSEREQGQHVNRSARPVAASMDGTPSARSESEPVELHLGGARAEPGDARGGHRRAGSSFLEGKAGGRRGMTGGGSGSSHRRTCSLSEAKSSNKAAALAAANLKYHRLQRTSSAGSASEGCGGHNGDSAEKAAKGGKATVLVPQDEDDDFCPTCLENYTTENPKIWTECGHHFHMPCIFEWMERKDTCPMCQSKMVFPDLQ